MIPVRTSPIPGDAIPGFPDTQTNGTESLEISEPEPFRTAVPPNFSTKAASAAGRSA